MKIKSITTFADDLIPSPIWDIYTREYRLPRHDREISVSQLIDSPQRRQLLIKHYELVERKITSLHNQILGIMVHLLFELKEFEELKENLKSALVKEDKDLVFELAKQFFEAKDKYLKLEFAGWYITGIYDLFEDGILYDFKITSQYALANKERLKKFEEQLQIYKFMLEKTKGIEVKAIKNVLLLKDFSISKAKVNSPLIVVEYEPWTENEIAKFIFDRLYIHETQDYCTEEDMWMVYQYKIGEKIFTSKDKAEAYAKRYGYTIRTLARPIRCLYYCEVAEFCEQFKKLRQVDNELELEYQKAKVL